MVEFNQLVFVNTAYVDVNKVTLPDCHAISIDWGDWYNKAPFNGTRDIRFVTYGGLDAGRVRLYQDGQDGFGPTDKKRKKIPIYITQRFRDWNKPETDKVVLNTKFKFADDVSGFKLYANDFVIRVAKCDHDQPFRMINYKGGTAPFGDVIEEWISPYIVTPNRPYIMWHLNPNRIHEPLGTVRVRTS